MDLRVAIIRPRRNQPEMQAERQTTPPMRDYKEIASRIADDFGANATYVEDLLRQFQHNPNSVDEEWSDYFQSLLGDDGSVKVESVTTNGAATAPVVGRAARARRRAGSYRGRERHSPPPAGTTDWRTNPDSRPRVEDRREHGVEPGGADGDFGAPDSDQTARREPPLGQSPS